MAKALTTSPDKVSLCEHQMDPINDGGHDGAVRVFVGLSWQPYCQWQSSGQHKDI